MTDMGKIDLQKIEQILAQERQRLAAEYGVKRMGVFGSFARGEQTVESDIDILVEFSRPIGLFRFVELERHLAELLGAKVDLATEQALKPAIKSEILGQVIYV